MYEVAYTSLFPHISTILEKKMHSSKVLNIISIFSRFAHIYSSVKKQILTTILTTIRARTEKYMDYLPPKMSITVIKRAKNGKIY